jgi:uncharacterized membrane protein
MDFMREWIEPVFRWIHVVAGIAWIGHLYFFNWVNAQLVKTYDADSKKKVVPELMPRALYFFRWGAAWTWITGVLLLAVLYYHPFKTMMADANAGGDAMVALAAGVGLWIVGPLVYDILWKSVKNEMVGVVISFILLAAAVAGLHFGVKMSGRALFIHIGALFGTTMAMNVWMRIWPAQKKIIGSIRDATPAPDASVAALAGLRSKHNTYMSVPLVFMMISQHAFKFYSERDFSWILLLGVVVVGWLLTKWIYTKSATAAPKTF